MFKLITILDEDINKIQVHKKAVYFMSRNSKVIGGKIMKYENNLQIFFETNKFLNGFTVHSEYITIMVGESVAVKADQLKKLQYTYSLELIREDHGFLLNGSTELGYYRKSIDLKKLYFVSKDTNQILWEIHHTIYNFLQSQNLIYCVGLIDSNSDNVKVFCLDINENKIIWISPDFDSRRLRINQNFKLLIRENSLLFGDTKNNVYRLDPNSGNLLQTWQFKSKPILYNNKIGCISTYLQELDLESLEFKEYDLRPEIKKHTGEESGFFVIPCISDGLGFISKQHSYENGHFQKYDLMAIDINSHKVVWKRSFDNIGIKSFQDLQYVNGKLYFLRGNGTLHIFEKEN